MTREQLEEHARELLRALAAEEPLSIRYVRDEDEYENRCVRGSNVDEYR